MAVPYRYLIALGLGHCTKCNCIVDGVAGATGLERSSKIEVEVLIVSTLQTTELLDYVTVVAIIFHRKPDEFLFSPVRQVESSTTFLFPFPFPSIFVAD